MLEPTPRRAPDAPKHDPVARLAPLERPAPRRSSRALGLTLAAAGVALFIVAALLAAPPLVRHLATARARDVGVDLTIDRVSVGLRGAQLHGVTAELRALPGSRASIRELRVEGLRGDALRAAGVDARLVGSVADVERSLAELVDAWQRAAGAERLQRVATAGAHVTWEGLAGPGSRLEAGGVGVEVALGAGADAVRVNVDAFELATPAVAVGPWSGALERDPATTRVRLALSPAAPDGPRVLAVWGPSLPLEVTATIPRTPLAELGIAPAAVGLPGGAKAALEAAVHGKRAPTGRVEASGHVTLFGVRPAGVPAPFDVRVEGSASGAAGEPLTLGRTTATLGPFVAGVTGTLTPHVAGLRVEAAFKTLPMPCEELARMEAKAMGPLAATLQALGERTGLVRVTGAVDAAGTIHLDTGAPGSARVDWRAKETCGVSLFGL